MYEHLEEAQVSRTNAPEKQSSILYHTGQLNTPRKRGTQDRKAAAALPPGWYSRDQVCLNVAVQSTILKAVLSAVSYRTSWKVGIYGMLSRNSSRSSSHPSKPSTPCSPCPPPRKASRWQPPSWAWTKPAMVPRTRSQPLMPSHPQQALLAMGNQGQPPSLKATLPDSLPG